jgi:hypothetical protein
MSYLASIVARAAGAEPVLQPRAMSRYESFAPLEENAIETAAPAPARVEVAPPTPRQPTTMDAPIAQTREPDAPRAIEVAAQQVPRKLSESTASLTPTPPAIREHEHTREHESRVETEQQHHHHHDSRETLLHETHTIVESTTHESGEPPLRALLQPQPMRSAVHTIEHLTREQSTTLRESQTPQAPPSIRVTIGRVDVRAITPQSNAAAKSAPPPKPFTLDDYVRLRDGERR